MNAILSKVSQQSDAPQLRIASYNLQKCIGLDLRRRPDRSLNVIDALEADITVLQEADKRLPPRPSAIPRQLIDHHGWKVVPFGHSAMVKGGSLGWHGNAMLLRPTVEVLQTSQIELPGLEPRGAIRADLETSIGQVRVIGVHLGLLRRHRIQQLLAITRMIRTLEPMPTIVVGDFNEWGTISALDASTPGLRFLNPGASFPALRPLAHLDRFALSDELKVNDCGVFTMRPAPIASDHLPIWATLRMAR